MTDLFDQGVFPAALLALIYALIEVVRYFIRKDKIGNGSRLVSKRELDDALDRFHNAVAEDINTLTLTQKEASKESKEATEKMGSLGERIAAIEGVEGGKRRT